MVRFKTRQFGVGGFNRSDVAPTPTKANYKVKNEQIQKDNDDIKKPVVKRKIKERIKNESVVKKKAKIEKEKNKVNKKKKKVEEKQPSSSEELDSDNDDDDDDDDDGDHDELW